MATSTGMSDMTDREIREGLRAVPPGALEEIAESLGWTRQEAYWTDADTWAKPSGDRVAEVVLPNGEGDCSEWPRVPAAIRLMARNDGLSVQYLMHRIAPENMGPEPIGITLEAISRAGVRRALTEQLAREVLAVMDRSAPDDPPELRRLFSQAHSALDEAMNLLESAERQHTLRLAESLQGEALR